MLYYMYNGHADVTALLDSTGTIQGSYYYDAFGNITEQTGSVNNNITFAGYQYDKETGLYYCNSRMYDPATARFLQEDTYRGKQNDPLSLNLYTYCTNNPIRYVDPTGHRHDLIWGYEDEQSHMYRNVNSHEPGVVKIDRSYDGKNIGVSYNPNGVIVIIKDGVNINSFGTSGSNVSITNEGSIGKIGMPSDTHSHLGVDNNGRIRNIDAGEGNTVNVNNNGDIGSIEIGNKSSADIKNAVTGGIENINIGANSNAVIDNRGVIKSVSSGDDSRTNLSNSATGIIGSLKTRDNSTLTGKDDGIIVSIGSNSSNSISNNVANNDSLGTVSADAKNSNKLICTILNPLNPLQYPGVVHNIVQQYIMDNKPNQFEEHPNLIKEVPIPNAGTYGKNGRADLVDPDTSEVWDIKPYSYFLDDKLATKADKQLEKYTTNYPNGQPGEFITPFHINRDKNTYIDVTSSNVHPGILYYQIRSNHLQTQPSQVSSGVSAAAGAAAGLLQQILELLPLGL